MTISQALAQTILAYTKAGMGERESVDKVFTYMDKHGLSGFKPAVASYLKRIVAMDSDNSVVKLYSAFPLESDDKAQILSKFSTDCTVEEHIDENLIGGFRTEHAYRYVDATTANALDQLKHHLLHP
jgi:F0F1-type ATP synthase delta subunit